MTDSNVILKNLMSNTPDGVVGNRQNIDTDEISTVSRIVQVRYRFYAVGVFLLGFVFVLWLLMPAFDKYNSKKASVDGAKNKLESIRSREDKYRQNIGFLETVQNEADNIISCVNRGELCESLSDQVKNKIGLARSYLLTNGMEKTKMDVDEKKIIENIDTFLVKLEPFLNNSSVNGEISNISIGDKSLDDGLYKVPVQINITFEDKSYLLSFVKNVEEYIPENENVRILYKIDRVSYDIINSQEPQDTTIYMNLYYYNE